MGSLKNNELESKQAVISEFIKSDMEKIYLVIGSEESVIYSFMDASNSLAAQNKRNLVFKYEIWKGENSRHFLYRWLGETVFGEAFVGFGPWSEIVDTDSQLMNQLRLLLDKDIRPLEIRFLEAMRFISRSLTPEQRLILTIVPRTSLDDKVLLDFFQAMLRVLPVQVKLIIGQNEQDILAQQADFAPTNRLILNAGEDSATTKIRERYIGLSQQEDIKGELLRILAHMVHPVDLTLISEITGETKDTVRNALESSDLQELLEQDQKGCFRLAFPGLYPFTEPVSMDFASMDKQAVKYYEKRFMDGSKDYSAPLHHSLGLFRIEDPEFFASSSIATYLAKMDMGGGDICEYELDHALRLVGDENDLLQARVFLTLGEIREQRTRSQEALDALKPAIKILSKVENVPDLQHALELKGRAAFSMRETDTAKAALKESLHLSRKMERDDLTADVLTQLAYVHYSLKQLQEAEDLYRESLNVYQSFSKENQEAGQRGEAAQWVNLGHTGYAKGDFKKSEEYHNKALEMYTALKDQKACANQWGYIGHTCFAAKDFDRAIEAYEQAATIEEQMGEPKKAAQRYANVGHTMYAQRKVDLAARSFQKALDKYRELGDADGEASQLSNLGLAQGDQGEFDRAVEYFEQAAQIYRELGDAINEATQTVKLGHVRRAQKQFDEAVKYYNDALTKYQSLEYQIGEGRTKLDLGQLYAEKKEWDKALEYYNRAKEVYAKIGHRENESLCFVFIGQTEQVLGKINPALESFRKAMNLYKQTENSLGVANVASQMGLLHYEQNNFGEAEKLYREALEVFSEKEDPEGEANLLSNLGTLYYKISDLDKARKEFEKALSLLRKTANPLGIAGVLQNLSYVYEKEEKYAESCDCLKEAKELFEHLKMSKEAELVQQHIIKIDKKAGTSLQNIRSELFPGLDDNNEKSGSKKGSKIGRNDPCSCGSGKKYKKCCGA